METQHKNRGFSLIELVVALAIMGAVVLFSVSMYGKLNTADVKSAAENIDVMLSTLRSESLTKSGDFYMEVSYDKSGDYLARLVERKKTKDASGNDVINDIVKKEINLGSKITIRAEKDDGTNQLQKEVKSYNLRIKCSKSNGSYILDECACVNKTDGLPVMKGVTSIQVMKGKTEKDVHMVAITGRHYVK